MKKIYLLPVLLLPVLGLFGQAVHRHDLVPEPLPTKEELRNQCQFYSADSLAGFDWATYMGNALRNFSIPHEMRAYMRFAENDFIKAKYKIKHLPSEFNMQANKKTVPTIMSGPCGNVDFEQGNFGGWSGGYGYNTNSNGPLTVSSAGISTLGNNSAVSTCSYHTIVTGAAGTDPVGGFPQLCPTGGIYSCRIGGNPLNTAVGTCPINDPGGICSNGETIQTSFVVTPSNCMFSYNYAVVLNDGGHANGEQPYFSVSVLDQSGTLIPCLNYYVQAQNSTFPPGFVNNGGTAYLPWTPTSLNLKPYMGQNVTIIFTAAGCIYGGHFAYAYIDCQCGPLQLITPAKFCTGNNGTLTAPPVSQATYQWAGPGIVGSATNQTCSVNAGGTYTVTITNPAGCAYTLDTTVQVFPGPTVTVNNPQGCSGSSVTLNAAGAVNYTWSPGLSSLTGSQVTATVTNTNTNYTLTGADANGCTGTVVATVSTMPTPSVTVTNQGPYCPGDVVPSATYTPNPNDPATTYQWANSNPAIGLAGSGTGSAPSFTATANTTPNYITSVVTVTPTLNGCVGPPSSYTITVSPIPVTSAPDVEYCPGVNTTAVTFTSNPAGPTTYTWVNTNSAIGLGSSGTGNLPSFQTINTGSTVVTATVHVVPMLNGCIGPDSTFVISINPKPVPGFHYSRACIGASTSFIDVSSIGTGTITNWNWDLNNDGLFLDATNPNPSTTLSPDGWHNVGLAVTSNKGCKNQVYEQVYVNPLPTAAFVGDNLVGCPVHPVNFTSSSSAPPPQKIIDWNWDFGNGQTSVSEYPTTVLFYNSSPILPITYTVSLTVTTDSGCTATVTKADYVKVYPQPIAGFSWDPADADILDPTVHIYNTSVGGNGNLPIKYYLGDVFIGQQDPRNWTNLTNPIHTYNDQVPYTYYVTQWVKNIYGCKDSITHPITINPAYTFYIPNAFSPNGDGRNEGFKGTGIGIDLSTYNLWIFDRWGNEIFHSNDLEETWNGRVNGYFVQEDVFVWKVRFSDISGAKHEFHGTVSLIK